MSKLGLLGAFIGGAVIGGLFTASYYKRKIESIESDYEADIESVKEEFKKKAEKLETKEEKNKQNVVAAQQDLKKPDLKTYVDKIEKNNYRDYFESNKKKLEPYQIPVDVFAYEDTDKDDNPYEKVTLTHYADGVLAADDGEEIDDVVGTVGNYEDLPEFKEGDTVYIRNEEYHVDYEITQDERTWDEELALRPHRVEV